MTFSAGISLFRRRSFFPAASFIFISFIVTAVGAGAQVSAVESVLSPSIEIPHREYLPNLPVNIAQFFRPEIVVARAHEVIPRFAGGDTPKVLDAKNLEVNVAGVKGGTDALLAKAMINPAATNVVVDAAGRPIAVKRRYDVSRIGDRGVGGGVNFYSLDKEVRMGKEMAQEVEQESKLFADKVVNEYVNRLGQNLVRNSDAQVAFTIKVIDSDEVNAFALPGGFFYVNTGLILAADNEAELAGVMAHEIAHVAARHATKNQTKKDIWNFASIPLVFFGGPAVIAVRNFASLAVPMSLLKFSRDAEREADLLGIQYEYAAGYDPSAMVNFFERLNAKEKQHHNFISRAFSTHPMNEDRVRRAQKEMDTMLPPNEEYLVTTSEFDEVKARLNKMTSFKRLEDFDPRHPTLRKASTADSSKDSKDDKRDDDPTLKRRNKE